MRSGISPESRVTIHAARPALSTRTRTAATIIQGRFAPPAHPFLCQDDIPERVARIASTVAYRRGVPLREQDLEDCAQNAWERLVPAFRRFNPKRGNGASLLTTTVTNATKSWLTARIAQMRDIRRRVRLPKRNRHHVELSDGDADLSIDEAPWHPMFPRRDEQRQLAADLWGFVEHLPEDLRAFITTLAAVHRKHTRAQRALGLTDDQYEALRARACRALTDAGLTGLP